MKKHPFAQAKLTGSVSLGSAVRPKPKFGIRNTDSDVGKFLITFAFDNGTDRATENVPQTVGPGGKMTASLTSPFRGVSEFSFGVAPPSKLVPHQRTVTNHVNTLSLLRRLRGGLR